MGTVAYMSPEQVRCQELDARTDLFSFGAVLYEMATGALAFGGESIGVIFKAILDGVPISVVQLNPDVLPKLEEIINKCLEKDRNLRYQDASDIRTDLQRLKRDVDSRRIVRQVEVPVRGKKLWRIVVPALLVVATMAGFLFWRSRKTAKLTDKDTIVVADFANTTGDPLFDGTLREGLSVQLEQSPFLSLVSESHIQQTLRLMGRPPDTKLTGAVTREICLRTASAAVLDGAISQVGTQYLLTLKAVNCSSGELLTSVESQASDKNQILAALTKMAAEMRAKLGESLSTVQKFDTPLVEATTTSLDALQALSLGMEAGLKRGDDAGSIAFFHRATELDPNFALAYSFLASAYGDLGESVQDAKNAQQSFDLRKRVSERERFDIETYYYVSVTGDFQKAQQSAELFAQIYPRDLDAHLLLGIVSDALGQNDKGLLAHQQALSLDPASSTLYGNLVFSNLIANRLDQASVLAEEAEGKKLDSYQLRETLYLLAFLRGNDAGMAQAVAWSAGKSAVEDEFLFYEAATNAYRGRLGKARELTDRAVTLAEQARRLEKASTYEAEAALRESLMGNSEEARRWARSALSHSNGRLTQYGAAQALAFAGDEPHTTALAIDLDKRFPENTLVQFRYLPSIQAQLALARNDAPKAIDLLKVAAPYELGWYGVTAFVPSLYPVYVRGLAYLAARRPLEATTEFEKIIDHRGIVVNEPIGALVHVQIGRAYAMQGDNGNAKAAYKDFLTLWKDADPDIPILKQAKAEYAKLQ